MSNPTSNFGWQMPTATDLVTDLPADFEVFGQAVDTALADLKGGTTGQVLSKNSATDMDFVWVTDAAGDITGVTAGTGISGGGTSGTVTVTNSMATAFTTSGDLIQATGSGTFARLGTGTTGQYLTTNGTTNSWGSISAGGMTLISTTTLSGATTTLSSIPATYNDLYVVVRNYLPATDLANLRMIINGDSGARYSLLGTDNASGSTFTFGASYMDIHNSADNVTTQNFAQITFPDYANSTTWKMAQITAINTNGTTTTSMNWRSQVNAYNQTPAITSLTFQLSAGNFTSGTVLLYGVK